MARRAISRTDEATFRNLYDPLRRFAAVVGPWEVEPDDLVQEALLRALRKGPLDRLDNPAQYLRRTILNLSYNHIRRRSTAQRATSRYAAGSDVALEPEYPSDLADLLSLEPAERAVLYLHDLYGYGFREIGQHLGIEDATARQIASRARRRLRAKLTKEAQS